MFVSLQSETVSYVLKEAKLIDDNDSKRASFSEPSILSYDEDLERVTE